MRAVLPVVRALVQAGHEVLVVLPTHLTTVFDGSGARVEPAMPNLVDAMVAEAAKLPATAGDGTLSPEDFTAPRVKMMDFVAGPHLCGTYQAVLPLAQDFRPDLVLRDGGELCGVLVAEKLGIPHISAPSGTGNIIDPESANELLNQRRKEVGLRERADVWSLYAHGRLDCVPHAYSFAEYPVPPAFTYRQPTPGPGQHVLPAELAALSGDKPIVPASVGSSLPVLLEMQARGLDLPDDMLEPAETFHAIVKALSSVDCHVVVSTGGVHIDTAELGPNIRLMDFVPQPLLLQHTQLFLTHCGYNSIREAIRAGTPMAALPQFGDQHHNANRLAEMGLGEWITDVSPSGVATVVEQVLHDKKIRQNVRTAQRAMLDLPDIETAVTHLECLAARTTAPRS
ncbi:glycosyltransferase [Streptomyces lunalinharesii]|uniref:N-glycosyltransferase n=1 Tax=Streptomyces lunalinharesii TaxID=333384 RepID=A0ABN3T083_9ACTN